MNSLGIYIHIPFCVKKCAYCDFYSVTETEKYGAYANALIAQIKSFKQAGKNHVVDSIYIGGGTPSVLAGEDIQRILAALRSSFHVSDEAEVTIEANPGTLDTGKLSAYREAGIDRLSMGLQSADDGELKRLSRIHTREEFEKMRDRKELLEWAEFCGNYYGTPRKYVTEQLMAGNNVILEIEVQGALQVKKIYPEGVLIFMVPPNLEELGNRLTKRGTEDKETINKRLRRALEEMELVEEYDYLVINDTVEQATEDMLTIVAAEKMKCSRNKNIKKIFKGEM